ncbi:hypothetical protein SAY87_021948 [Trapa incisa]|uniref:Uncharacterized protein n=1 Tax=Trapa incisa TaxID=236973 RepID=A0AAN7JRR4_9MYRT|nr:hypothetical protein SAY87_021948 [Trapa incisa]
MALSPQIDGYIKHSIDCALGLPFSAQTVESTLRTSEEVQKGLSDRCALMRSRLKEKDCLLELAREEASMNALALKKFVEENQRLAEECTNLLAQRDRWERECSLYEKDRESLMDFGNEAHERVIEAESRVEVLDEEVEQLSNELQQYKYNLDSFKNEGSGETETMTTEDDLLESVFEMVARRDGCASAHAFLEANSWHEGCRKLLKMLNGLRPSTQKVLSLLSEVKALEKEKELLRTNLHTAEEEVKLLFDGNSILEKENRSLLQHLTRTFGPGESSVDSAFAKSQKRKSSPNTSSPVEKRIDFKNEESARFPLSPRNSNSPVPEFQK